MRAEMFAHWSFSERLYQKCAAPTRLLALRVELLYLNSLGCEALRTGFCTKSRGCGSYSLLELLPSILVR